jgi:hypothetical protein
MIYGGAKCLIKSKKHGVVYLTVKDGTCTIKQDDDLIRLERVQLRELANDIIQSLDDLEAGKLA